ncbi:hypothetical protein PCYB_143590 [Plasmodium cynomolgi strain B]|uniref:Uncharacterized protein n=1 Tax=Plasmodium cynomolgi (strain B) TaxID=1120755 RepID=K6UET9_PLACD|nr:hypothetical protein PCYB_143590 [Plasmodium cynomolgi strain B]GAB68931.1 hypothetical protein PCYB_143590 [Plasmodium cynomolgi strain B]
MSNLAHYLCLLVLLLSPPVRSRGYVCDFSSSKYNLDFDDYYADVTCYHEIGQGDTIGYIGDIYKHVFPIINEEEVVYDCPMYYDEKEKKISVGNLIVTFEAKPPSIKSISKDILKKHIKEDIEKKLHAILNGTDYTMGNMDSVDDDQHHRYMEQSIEINETQTSNLQSVNIDKEHCNNDECVDLFENSSCSSLCGGGYRLRDGYDVRYDVQSVIPCNHGDCTHEDSIEPLVIFAWTSIVFFCIMITLLIITIYSLLHISKQKVADPFYNYDSNIRSSDVL